MGWAKSWNDQTFDAEASPMTMVKPGDMLPDGSLVIAVHDNARVTAMTNGTSQQRYAMWMYDRMFSKDPYLVWMTEDHLQLHFAVIERAKLEYAILCSTCGLDQLACQCP